MFHNCNFKNVSIINNTNNSELILSSVVSFVKMGLLLRSHPWSINMSWVVNFCDPKYVTRHEKIGLMCTKYTPLHYSTYLTFCVSYTCSVKIVLNSPVVTGLFAKVSLINYVQAQSYETLKSQKVVTFCVHISQCTSQWMPQSIISTDFLHY